MRVTTFTPLLTLLLLFSAVACNAAPEKTPPAATLPAAATAWGTEDPWNDGQAELAVMRGTITRYGAPREIELRLVSVAEDLDRTTLVKSDRPAEISTIRVLKLNLKRRFTTGVYDYDQMASVFLEAGSLRLVKETVTHHELCGNAFSILEAPRADGPARLRTFSYFDGLAAGDRSYRESGLLTPEALPLALRGVPREEGWSSPLRLLPTLVDGRPAPADPETAEIRVGAVEQVETGLGVLPGRLVEVRRGAGTDRFWFEEGGERRLLRWRSAEGMNVRLEWSERLRYWTLNGPGDETLLERPPTAR